MFGCSDEEREAKFSVVVCYIGGSGMMVGFFSRSTTPYALIDGEHHRVMVSKSMHDAVALI
jgi:hypothetical protein